MTPQPGQHLWLPALGPDDEEAARASRRTLVRRGSDVISYAYRTGHGPADPATDEDPSRYLSWDHRAQIIC